MLQSAALPLPVAVVGAARRPARAVLPATLRPSMGCAPPQESLENSAALQELQALDGLQEVKAEARATGCLNPGRTVPQYAA